MAPTIDSNGVPDSCLSITLRGEWGHYRRVGRTKSRQTYHIPPRTTLAGLFAAIVGAPRDSYYDVFSDGVSAVAVTSLSDIRTVNVPQKGLGTNPDEPITRTASSSLGSLTFQDPGTDNPKGRQIYVHEYVVDPVYRVDIALENESFYDDLRSKLDAGESVYPPSLGKSELLCTVEDVETENVPQPVDDGDYHDVDSVVPIALGEAIPQSGVTYSIERSPAVMEQYRNGRRTTRYDDYVYTRHEGDPVRIRNDSAVTPVTVENRCVVFR